MIVLYTVLCGIGIKTAYAEFLKKQHMRESHKNSLMLQSGTSICGIPEETAYAEIPQKQHDAPIWQQHMWES